ncbi:flagellar biosynthetic protein FliO [Pseudomonas akapageensis]|uniref:flagellar biosynthetic protein FliO n=1 Tax=Pseudomonas akapageensis TaxID=2609961 RepID=UPI0014089334
MSRLLAILLLLPLSALAEQPAAATNASMASQLTQMVLGLLLVLGLIFFLAWLLRRVQRATPRGGQVIELVGAKVLGPRERLVLVQVGNEQILLGLTPGRITPLHVMAQPVEVPAAAQQATPEFAQRLMELLGKDQKDKK